MSGAVSLSTNARKPPTGQTSPTVEKLPTAQDRTEQKRHTEVAWQNLQSAIVGYSSDKPADRLPVATTPETRTLVRSH